ncbi:3-methyl-2-oxobutanoate hydroxymethyltransferase [Xanthomonas translucens pv. arrhenatheri]|jgi:3-methyl-2-oxobutanoate hydroxymethyltransferase|uniref:3-methyl-2-oxobutanoate hydroxymethyltransferase n=3 Tax=Xanthomonas graminis TaxID=3390026 RepID=A0A0K2ZBT1_9XANT|nr:3-methyl-2-oxobutanoate hydroxymethyltransferase [Xanthomonas translucens]EKU24415.1 3-methyl-2-oxobutanoatehydroxymethyltransferase [Xanthomonas translucens pv. graminis ART-Xtg29]OAX53673.1 3-methyl-2-oxobutanoate hydroxymethyltransferase [Xanthomonas translucens pv. poae]OAX59210.1 3-methyl-2-oxobutanoate hydroxymethyltransferase [Xanthomonas translucens pv. graminis]OAX66713.1 3-methyl-2-oxobutanoate hydroxymethyltransferase [Xanthomonas translucens pv. arrhenatheri]UKE53070.1 3-methyl-
MSSHADSKPWTVPALAEAKRRQQKLVMLTAYDAGFARAFEANGVDLILIGDSLGMVVQGHDSTLPVTVDDIVYHTAAVARVLQRALLVADLPFQSDATPERALDAATRLLQAGAEMVKLEGAGHKLEVIRFLSERDIPVCSHLGLTPQSVLTFGGYKIQGREQAAAAKLLADAKAAAAAGAALLVLECVPSPLAARITAEIGIPTIGIGAGPDCDGQVLVLHDFLGLDSGHRRPRFVKDFLAEGGSIAGAVRAYADAVRAGTFPDAEHAYAK